MRLVHMKVLVGLAFALVASTTADDEGPRIQIPSGTIRGFYKKSQYGKPYESYEGIPFAQPPVGKLRFQPPQSIKPWYGELDGTKPGPECLQYLIIADHGKTVKGTEDCLYLNVYTPGKQSEIKNNGKLLPVIFAIHGGSFQFGSGADQAPPDYIMNKDIVLVSTNYRVGPFGFLSTEDHVIPGNMGLKDQVLALRWVSSNIASFGGDPNSVTLWGQSAGAASVHFHYLSPMSRGLFHRGVSVSGTALNSWSQIEASLEKTKKLGAMFGCPTTTNEELASCLQNCPAEDLMAAVPKFMGWLYNSDVPFGPVVEKNCTTPFMDKSPVEIINSGESADLPWITTVVSGEGLYTGGQFVDNDKLLENLDKKWETIAPHLLDFNFTIPISKQTRVARKIRKHYLGDKAIGKDTVANVVQLMGDRLYIVDAEKSARIQAKANKSPVRMYYFTYRGEYSLTEEFTGTKNNYGVSHADDEFYVFPGPGGFVKTKPDLKMTEYMVNLWTSFASEGVPEAGIDWLPVDPSKKKIQYLHIAGPDNQSIESNANFGEKKFWSSIDFDENKMPRHSLCDRITNMINRMHRF